MNGTEKSGAFTRLRATAAVLAAVACLHLRGATPLALTAAGVVCPAGDGRTLTLGIPALDGRGTHAPPLSASIVTDGRALDARFGPPFDGVVLHMRILEGDRVEYRYDHLPDDARLVMCQFNIPRELIVPGLAVAFDRGTPREIPATPGKTNAEARLADVNARSLAIRWPSGDGLGLTVPNVCWHGIQDARVWGKKTVAVCLTPALTRDEAGGTRSTLVLAFTRPGPE